jgi:hypothetical protein
MLKKLLHTKLYSFYNFCNSLILLKLYCVINLKSVPLEVELVFFLVPVKYKSL